MNVSKKLAGGDRRSIGRGRGRRVEGPTLFDAVFDGMSSEDPLIRMRSADAVEKITAIRPEYLQPHKDKLIRQIANVEQQEVRWHVAQMLPRLHLSPGEREIAFSILLGYLNDESKIVKTFSMQALAELAEVDVSLRPRVLALLEDLSRTGSPAMRSRGKKLLDRLNKGNR